MFMDMKLALDIFWIEFWHILALIISLYLNGTLMRKAEKSPLRNRYLAVQSCLLIWIISKILKTISPNVDMRWLFIVTQYLGVSFLGPCFFLFSFRTVKNRDPHWVVVGLLIMGSIICFIIVVTNPVHSLFYSSYDFYRDRFGPLFYITMLYQYTFMVISLFILAGKIIFSRQSAIQERLIGLAALIPFGVNIGYITDIINPMFDITPLAITLVLGLFALAAFRYRFLGIISLADREIREGINDPILIYDRKGRPLPFSSFDHPMISDQLLRDKSPGETVLRDNSYYRLQKREKKRGYSLEHWADVSHIRQLEKDRGEAVARLEELGEEIYLGNKILLEQARKEAVRLAQLELHDTLGHSLTQVILLLRSALVLERKDTKSARKTLEKAVDLCRQSLIKMTDLPLSQAPALQLLTAGLHQMEEEFSDSSVVIMITVKGYEIPLPWEMKRTLIRCSQEAVTNSIKHGKADRIDIIVRYTSASLLLVIADNGVGYLNLIPGMGMTGMKERISSLKGTLRCQGEPEGGVMLTIQVPLN